MDHAAARVRAVLVGSAAQLASAGARRSVSVCPEARLDYRGYTLWRAVVSLPPLAEAAPLLDGTVSLPSRRGSPGYLVAMRST